MTGHQVPVPIGVFALTTHGLEAIHPIGLFDFLGDVFALMLAKLWRIIAWLAV